MSAIDLEFAFNNLKKGGYKITSEQTRLYNCIAFAAGEIYRWWWPIIGAYWPKQAPRQNTIESFIIAFGTLGYLICNDGTLESGFEKVAIYAKNGVPKHMARQLPSGMWTSKCGILEDIEHETLEALDGFDELGYGQVVKFLKRPAQFQKYSTAIN